MNRRPDFPSTFASVDLARESDFSIGGLRVSPSHRQILACGRQETVQPRPMQVLVALARAKGAVLSRDDLIETCWDGITVGDDAINRCIAKVRQIADFGGGPHFEIETVPRVGYRLIAPEPLPAGQVHSQPAGQARPAPIQEAPPWRSRWQIGAAITAVMVAAGIVVAPIVFTSSLSPGPTTIAVIGAQPNSAELASGLTADLARLSNVRGAIAFGEGSGAVHADYRLTVAQRSDRSRPRADVALLRNGSPDVLWSASFAGTANLRDRAAVAVSMVTECALDKNSDPVRSNADELRLIFSGCERLDYYTDDVDDIAVSVWRRIVAREPDNARALATLAYIEAVRSTDNLESSVSAALRAAARTHLEKARALNGQLGLTYAAEAVLIPNSRYGDKLAMLKRGIERDPDCAALHQLESYAFQQVGFMNGAVASAREAVALDPAYASRRTWLALALAYNGLTDEARHELAATERIWPDSPALKDAKNRFDYRYGDAAGLIRKIDRGTETPNSPPAFALGIERSFLLARLRSTPANIEAAASIALKNDGSPGVVQNLVALGRVDRAYELFNDARTFALLRENTDVLFRSFMRPFFFDRRFMPLAGKLGLVRYWLSSGLWPSFCYDKDVPYNCEAEAKRLHA